MSDLRRASRGAMTLHNGSLHREARSALEQTTGSASSVHPLTAAVQFMPAQLTTAYSRTTQYEAWQDESWSFYESLGEFNYGATWYAEALSRCRLNVAVLAPGGDEPEPLKSGAATDIIESLAGGIDGQSAMLKSFGVQLAVPGDGYLVGNQVRGLGYTSYAGPIFDAEPDESGHVWTVQPKNALRKSRRSWSGAVRRTLGLTDREQDRDTWEMQVDEDRWVQLSPESLVVRVWNRNEHFPWRASSAARAALPTMREIDMYNRYIMATLVSRVALNGVWLIPEEVVLPANPAYEDQQDPFFAELLDIMREVIKNPGSPASAAPLPLRVPGDLIDKFKHLTFATPLDDQIFSAREGAIKRLAASLNLPQEVLTGMGATNHWSSLQLTEDAIKIHISPGIETITRCLTVGYLYPMLRAAGEPLVDTKTGGRIIVWYDPSPLTQRPDRSDLAIKLNGMGVIDDAATRRETGFNEADEPDDKELKIILKRNLVLQGGQLAGPAYEKLTGETLVEPQEALPSGEAPAGGSSSPSGGPGGVSGPPAGSSSQTTTPTNPSSSEMTKDAQRPPETRDNEAPEA